MSKTDVSVIVPCYNEGPSFEDSVEQIVSELKKLKKTWELIFVEDKSTDNTRRAVEKLVKEIYQAKAVFHKKNEGRGKSVSDGIRTAKGEICGYLDVDLEVSESYIPLFIKEIENGADLVVGKRFYEGGLKNLTRFVSSKAYALAVKSILKLPIDDTEAGCKFFNRKKILPILNKIKSKHWFWDTEICAQSYWHGLKVTQIPVLFKRREDKKSTVRLIPDTIDYIRNLIRLKSQVTKYKFQMVQLAHHFEKSRRTNFKSQIINSKRF